jgi:hypothetical protein
MKSKNVVIKSFCFIVADSLAMVAGNVSPLGEVANFVTVYFPLKIKFLAERKREFTTKIAILPNGC